MKIEKNKPCAWCDHFKPMVDDEGRRIGLAVAPGGVVIGGHNYDAIGVGHCEEPTRPLGLVMATYHCVRWHGSGPDRDTEIMRHG